MVYTIFIVFPIITLQMIQHQNTMTTQNIYIYILTKSYHKYFNYILHYIIHTFCFVVCLIIIYYLVFIFIIPLEHGKY